MTTSTIERFGGIALCALVGCGYIELPEEDTADGTETEGDDDNETPDPSASSTGVVDDGTGENDDGTTGSDTTNNDDDDDGTTEEPPEPIDWEPCRLYTGGAGMAAECVTFDVPLSWDEPEGQTIDLFIKRVGGGDGSIQLYMLYGGPGGSSVGFEDDAELLVDLMPELDIYLIDHRGTGRSSALPDLPEALDQWGDQLAHFNTSNAARDLGWMVERAREPGKSVQIYGASYGSYWSHRYLQLFPDQADGATLLGIAAPGFNFNYWERDFNEASTQMLSLCNDDPECGPRLGPDAVTHGWQIIVDVYYGHCAEAGLNVDALRSFFASRAAWTWEERALVPAILYRLERCSPADVVALHNAAPQIENWSLHSTEPPAWSATLGNHVRLSELTDDPLPSDEELTLIHGTSMFTLGSMVGQQAQYDAWPRYIPDEYDGQFAETSTPMLMLHGEFDPNAPLEQALSMLDHFDGPNQHFYLMPHGLHAWPSPYPGGDSCMRSLFLQFTQDPAGPLDDCSDDVYPMTFDQHQLAPGFFGTENLWD